MPELTIRLDNTTWRALQKRARQRHRTEAEEAADILRRATLDDRDAVIQRLLRLHQQLGQPCFTSSVELIRTDRER